MVRHPGSDRREGGPRRASGTPVVWAADTLRDPHHKVGQLPAVAISAAGASPVSTSTAAPLNCAAYSSA